MDTVLGQPVDQCPRLRAEESKTREHVIIFKKIDKNDLEYLKNGFTMRPYIPGALGRSSVLAHVEGNTSQRNWIWTNHLFPHHHDIPFSDLTCRASPPSAAMLALKSFLTELVVLESIF